MGGEEHDPADAHLRQEPIEPLPLFWIEAGGRLVDDEDPRVAGDRLREPEPLPHAAGVAADLPLRGIGEVDALEEFAGEGCPPLRPTDPFQAQEKLEHRLPGEVGIEPEILGQEPEPLADELGLLDDVGAVEPDVAGRRLNKPGDDAHEGRLPGAVGAEEAEHSLGNIEIDPLERAHRAGVDLHEAADGEAFGEGSSGGRHGFLDLGLAAGRGGAGFVDLALPDDGADG